jgi:outer membrane lipoprotein-sorting protein
MNKIIASTLLLFLAVCAGARAEVQAPPFEWPKQYSAELVVTSQANTAVKTNTKIFVDGPKTRTEMEVNGMKSIAIMLTDKKVMYSIMPTQKMYFEMPLTDSGTPAQVDETAKWEPLGSETLNGQECLKYKVTSTVKDHTTTMIYWIAKADKLPVRMATEDGQMVTDWTNFKKGAQNAALFELPTDYKKMSMPGMAAPPPPTE